MVCEVGGSADTKQIIFSERIIVENTKISQNLNFEQPAGKFISVFQKLTLN